MMSSSAVDAALVPKTFAANVMKIVFGSTSAGLPSAESADHDDERDRDQGVDEGAVAALEVERDLRVLVGVLGLADVARGGLHRDHVPGQEERERDVQRQPAVAVERGEEAGAVDVLEAGELAEVDDGRIEDPGDRQERQRDHREDRERGREERPEAQARGRPG